MLITFTACEKSELDLIQDNMEETKGALKSGANTFSVLTYNVSGLDKTISGGNPDVNTVLISPLLNDFDIVCVQEDFNYHDDLISATVHPYLSSHSGVMAIGDGLNTISKVPFYGFYREEWNDCNGIFTNGSDCLTPKGFTFARHFITDEVVVDVYNLHADSGTSSGDYEARNSNFNQMVDAITYHSYDNAVIVVGDMNSLFCDGDIGVKKLLNMGFKDGYLEEYLGGVQPPHCDEGSIDKILFKSSSLVDLELVQFLNERDNFLDSNGNELADHDPRSAVFTYSSIDLQKIALKSYHNTYIKAESNGGDVVNSTATAVGPWEQFHVLNNDADPTVLKSGDVIQLRTGKGYFITAEPNGGMVADRTGNGSWEDFILINHTDPTGPLESGDVVTLKSAHNTYVVSEPDADVLNDRTAIGAWEKFTVTIY
jgi:exonuclease III